MKSTLPAELKPDQVVAIIDTREQAPLDLSPLRSEAGTLATGDYSVKGLVNVVAIERKSLTDLLGCIGQDRERFDREVIRLLAIPFAPDRRSDVGPDRGRQLEIEGHTRRRRRYPAWHGLPGRARHHGRRTTSGRAGTFPGCSSPRHGEGDGGNCGRWPPPSAPRRTPRSRNPSERRRDRAKRTSTSIRGGEIRPVAFLGSVQRGFSGGVSRCH